MSSNHASSPASSVKDDAHSSRSSVNSDAPKASEGVMLGESLTSIDWLPRLNVGRGCVICLWFTSILTQYHHPFERVRERERVRESVCVRESERECVCVRE